MNLEYLDKTLSLNYFIKSAESRNKLKGPDDDGTRESINNAKRLAKQLNKENELPEWIKNIN
jgi:hypothetical protein